MRNAEFGDGTETRAARPRRALRSAECETERPGGNGGSDRVLVTRVGLAAALSVSLHTVDRMLAAEEIPCIRLRGRVVRFYLADVVECLRKGTNKFGRGARVAADTETGGRGDAERGQAAWPLTRKH